MRPSTFVTLTLALFIGLGAAVAVKMSGILNDPPAPEKPKPIPTDSPQVLVARANLFKDYIIKPGDLITRPLSTEEAADYAKNREKYLPPNPAIGHYRVAIDDITAGEPLLVEHLQPIALPDPLHKRLLPLTRPLSVTVDKDRSVGGLIQSGDWVDVFLTCEITTTAGASPERKTAMIARNVPVIAKRDILWNVTLPSDGGPVKFTLAPNLYRAALIEYVRNYGTISLFPVSRSEKQRLDDERLVLGEFDEGLDADDTILDRIVTLAYNNSFEEYTEELERLDAFSRGEGAVIGKEDLVRLFKLPPLEPSEPPVSVELLTGVQRSGSVTFVPTQPGVFTPSGSSSARPEYLFHLPEHEREKAEKAKK